MAKFNNLSPQTVSSFIVSVIKIAINLERHTEKRKFRSSHHLSWQWFIDDPSLDSTCKGNYTNVCKCTSIE